VKLVSSGGIGSEAACTSGSMMMSVKMGPAAARCNNA